MKSYQLYALFIESAEFVCSLIQFSFYLTLYSHSWKKHSHIINANMWTQFKISLTEQEEMYHNERKSLHRSRLTVNRVQIHHIFCVSAGSQRCCRFIITQRGTRRSNNLDFALEKPFSLFTRTIREHRRMSSWFINFITLRNRSSTLGFYGFFFVWWTIDASCDIQKTQRLHRTFHVDIFSDFNSVVIGWT